MNRWDWISGIKIERSFKTCSVCGNYNDALNDSLHIHSNRVTVEPFELAANPTIRYSDIPPIRYSDISTRPRIR